MESSLRAQPENNSPANASLALTGMTLEGIKRGSSWHVGKKLDRQPNATGGTFSVGYEVKDENGNAAFMKATDIGLMSRGGGSILDQLTTTTNAQKFERQILDICHGNNMDKIVRCLDYGELPTTHNNIQDVVFFIIFEKAQGDVRTQVRESQRSELSWSINALHNLAVAVRQLHGASISHNDIKPSNLLVFDEELQKLADLGRATGAQVSGPYDSMCCPGANNYAAPEQLYRFYAAKAADIPWDTRRASDLYLLGSMLNYFITGTMLTPTITSHLRPEHSATNWRGFYKDVLPYWRDAYGAAILNFERCLPTTERKNAQEVNQSLLTAFKELCEPDPDLRGHPSLRGSQNQYNIEKYVSLFNLLRTKVRI